MNKAEELIACLEGEIAKRDETIARLEPRLNRSIQANYDLRAELSALKAHGVDAGLVEALEQYKADCKVLESVIKKGREEYEQLHAELSAENARSVK